MKKTTLISILLLVFSSLWAQEQVSKERTTQLYFSLEGGFFYEGVEVSLYSPGGEVYYTLNGSEPRKSSSRYQTPISINSTTVLRAVAINKDSKSTIISHTYFINEPETDFATVSIGVSPYSLFDPYNGMLMQGAYAQDTLWDKPGANFWTRKEIRVNAEIFESNGQCVYNSNTGFRLFGGMSRLFPQKSFALVARKSYGESRFRHRLFGKDGLRKFKFLVFRNSGSDFGKTHFRDAFMTTLVEDWDIQKQDYRPAHVYINGRYWGIYNIREKVNRYFIEGHQEVNKDSIDFLEHRYTLKRGSRRPYLKLVKFIRDNDLSNPANYAYLKTLIDVDNFIDLQIAQIYFDNQDAGGNIKFWKPQTLDGRWRWILYDTDWGFGLHDKKAYLNNSLAFHTKPNGPSWPNPPWSTFFLRKLLENPSFEKTFLNRFADHLNYSFEPEKVERTIDQFYEQYLLEIPRHLKRWRLSKGKWEREVDFLHTFAKERPTYMRMHLMERFNTGSLCNFNLEVSKGGTVIVNDNIELKEQHFEGKYFEQIPLKLKVIADNGYRFSHWEGMGEKTDLREIYLPLYEKEYNIRAVFTAFNHPMIGKVMINEVNPNNSKAGDWIEIFNYSKERVSLNGWMLSDKKNEFVFPNVSIDPNDYLIICRDSSKFHKTFPQAYNFIGGLKFGISKRKEQLQLFSEIGASVDSMGYKLPPLDTAFTLSLLLPNINNSDPENWSVRRGIGTPNLPNPYFVESRIRAVQAQWMQVGVAASVFLLCILLLALRRKRIL